MVMTSSLDWQEKFGRPMRDSSSEQNCMKSLMFLTFIGGGFFSSISSTCSISSSTSSGANGEYLFDVRISFACSMWVLLEAELPWREFDDLSVAVFFFSGELCGELSSFNCWRVLFKPPTDEVSEDDFLELLPPLVRGMMNYIILNEIVIILLLTLGGEFKK